MKEQYFEAEMDIVVFTPQDVINTSSMWTPPSLPAGELEGPAADAFL